MKSSNAVLATPYLAKILIYPVKSLDGLELQHTGFMPGGALQHDRQYALMDPEGAFVDGKRYASIYRLRSHLCLDTMVLSLRIEGETSTRQFHLQNDCLALETWLSEYFAQPITLAQETTIGFPNDVVSPGPTVISTATLETIASWFPELTIGDIRRRFRANLELDGVPPFWEDRLFSASGEPVPFCIGDVRLLGINPCQRCIVPTRNSYTGDATSEFQKMFVAQRKLSLPEWAAHSRFNHFYRLSVNTRVPMSEVGKVLRVGDRVYVDPER